MRVHLAFGAGVGVAPSPVFALNVGLRWPIREGERNGESRLLLKQLRLRFGELPAAVVARVEAAEVPDLDVWGERVMTASRLEDVLGPLPA
jgi:class 3 adenylate cyclase